MKSLEQFKETNYTKILSKKDLNNLTEQNNEKKNDGNLNNTIPNENGEYYDETVFEQISKKNRKFKLLGHTDSIFSISISPDKKYIISGSYDETIRFWSIYTKTTLVIYLGHFAPVLSVKFSPFS